VEPLQEVLRQVTGYIYPNEVELHWGLLVVVYPYLTGLVAGAFILASLVRVFNVKEVQPTYRLALLTALAYLIVAPLPLLAHLGRPSRAFEIFLTPNFHSAMAMFGFVYAWYLMVVLLLEIWFDYRKDLVLWSSQEFRFIELPDAFDLQVRIGRRLVQEMRRRAFPIELEALLLGGDVGFVDLHRQGGLRALGAEHLDLLLGAIPLPGEAEQLEQEDAPRGVGRIGPDLLREGLDGGVETAGVQELLGGRHIHLRDGPQSNRPLGSRPPSGAGLRQSRY